MPLFPGLLGKATVSLNVDLELFFFFNLKKGGITSGSQARRIVHAFQGLCQPPELLNLHVCMYVNTLPVSASQDCFSS